MMTTAIQSLALTSSLFQFLSTLCIVSLAEILLRNGIAQAIPMDLSAHTSVNPFGDGLFFNVGKILQIITYLPHSVFLHFA